MSVSVVCPFFNEAGGIVPAVEKLLNSLKRDFNEWELILVDDGSTDNSVHELLQFLDHNQSRLKIISLKTNHGRGRAIMTGIREAKGETIVTTEADGSWGSDIVLKMTELLDKSPEIDFVIASPHLPGGGLIGVPWRRRILSSFGNRLISSFFESSITMNTGMTRAYRRKVIYPLEVWENGKEFHLEVLLKLRSLGFECAEIPATITWGTEKKVKSLKSKRKSSTKILRTISSHLRFTAIARPTSYFAAFAFVFLFLSVLFLSLASYNLLIGEPSIFPAVVSLLNLILSLFFTCFSILFVKLGEVLREQWVAPYKCQGYESPPSAEKGKIIFPKP